MDPNYNLEEAIELLQTLGLSENEAKCYVGLTRMDAASARKLSEVADIPRTRVYDATRVLQGQGLVEIQHTSPKQFRAVPIQEAIDRIRDRYQARFDELKEALNTIEPVESDDDAPGLQVWSVSGREAIESRAIKLVQDATAEVILVLGDESLLTDQFIEALTDAVNTLEVVIYAPTETIRNRIHATFPAARTVLPGPERLQDMTGTGNLTALGRILLIDQSASLISSIDPDTGDEQAVLSQGPKPPLGPIICQLMVGDGLPSAPEEEP